MLPPLSQQARAKNASYADYNIPAGQTAEEVHGIRAALNMGPKDGLNYDVTR